MLKRQSTQHNDIKHYTELSRYFYKVYTYHITIQLINANNPLYGVTPIANNFFIIDFKNDKYCYLSSLIAHQIGDEINYFDRVRWIKLFSHTMYICRCYNVYSSQDVQQLSWYHL